ncbi:hypothetical protein FISHEDRAFT_56680 [Fistulina hepatica ATCC 64428]|uniref:lytic cellulose monooxygenase (C4-dehydrogenating) n=1 Tax=Fistulina hepatica ATCC 64428 TaxID=1128425 RepID=A0A0D7AIG6_9AGAR|nr:hypothetical protein FISHEDRAFT_56680 [Fistulina hepatica ATCC 64428]
MKSSFFSITFGALVCVLQGVSAHYTFPSLVVNGTDTEDWVYVRMTNNYDSQAPVTDVTSEDLRCYDSATNATAKTATVAAGSNLGIMSDSSIYHPGVVNVYMASASSDDDDAESFDGSGEVWFKVYQISAVTNNGTSITFPAQDLPGVNFTLPEELPSGQYLVRMEAIALHEAETYGGGGLPTFLRPVTSDDLTPPLAQFYISCGQVNVVNGGSGTPSPLVEIPGVYTGYEPGLLIDIYYPIPTNYTQPGPDVWTG